MSRDSNWVQILHVGFPRVSGDEPPGLRPADSLSLFSPRERG